MSFFMRLDTIQRETAAAATTTTAKKNHIYSAFACSESRSFSDLTFKKQVVCAYIHIFFKVVEAKKKEKRIRKFDKHSHSFDACVVLFLTERIFYISFPYKSYSVMIREKKITITTTTSTTTTMMFKKSSELESVCWLNTCTACHIG